MQHPVEKKVREYIMQQHLLEPGSRIVIGLSGGADSVCLLRVFCGLREELELSLLAVHVHHGIRGRSADEDAWFSEKLCKQMDVPFRLICTDVPALAAEQGCSIEEAGRTLRYEAFEQIRAAEDFDVIAAAHHADDNAETVLLNLCRGTGPAGLCGMSPASGRIIRPLLCVQRYEIEDYLREIDQEWRTDETNADLSYRRNRIRHAVMPQFSAVNPQTVSHINETARILRESEAYLMRQTREAAARCLREVPDERGRDAPADGPTQADLTVRKDDPSRADFTASTGRKDPQRSRWKSVDIIIENLHAEDPLLQERVLLYAMERVCGSRRDLGQVHVRSLLELAKLQSGRRIDLPYGMRAQRIYDVIRIQRQCTAGTDGSCAEETVIDLTAVRENGPLRVKCAGYALEFSVFSAQDADLAALTRENPYTKYVDCAKIKNRLAVRFCRPSDEMTINAAGHRKTMRRYLIDEKVPQPDRARTAVVADGSSIVWVIGGRIGCDYRLTDETRQILKMEISL